MSRLDFSPLQLYKNHHEVFLDDREYYYQFCKGFKTLELFAGFGRISNFLINRGVDVEIVEIEPEFAKLINLDEEKKYIENVLTFSANKQFDRIIGAYNSFSLLTDEASVKKFFTQIDTHLKPDGYASLSYFPVKSWGEPPAGEFNINDVKIKYYSTHDLSRIKERQVVWIDNYETEQNGKIIKEQCTYPLRAYNDANEVQSFIKHTQLILVDEIHDYGLTRDKISDPGWVEYVFKKKR